MTPGFPTVFCRAVAGLALAVLLPVNGALAQSDRGYYLSALGGYGWLADTDLDGVVSADADFDGGFGAGAAAGYDFGRWRVEAELLYQTNDADSVRGTLPTGWSGGDFSSLGVAVNGAWEFDLGGSPAAVSYVGAGLVWLQEIDIDFDTAAGERSYSGDDVGVQLFAGARYRLGERWLASAELRWLRVDGVRLDGEGAAPGRIAADYARTSLLLGLGYRF